MGGKVKWGRGEIDGVLKDGGGVVGEWEEVRKLEWRGNLIVEGLILGREEIGVGE